MSFFLGPPALFILGMLLYHFGRRFRWDQRATMLVEAEVIVSVPVMKTHILTSVTMGMKNMYGTFTEENKAKYHGFGIGG